MSTGQDASIVHYIAADEVTLTYRFSLYFLLFRKGSVHGL